MPADPRNLPAPISALFRCAVRPSAVPAILLAAALGFTAPGKAQESEASAETSVTDGLNPFPRATFATPTPSVNRMGKPQQWQTAADGELPDGFAPGGELIMVWNSEPGTLTPFVSRDAYATRVYRQVLEPLIWHDVDTLRWVPGLARDWSISEDGLEITFDLFEHATFSDGHPVTAEDVVFSFDLIANPEIDAPVLRSYIMDNVASWRAEGDHRVVFTMKQPYFKALEITGNNWVLPKHVYGDVPPSVYNTDMRKRLVGSGPWVLGEWNEDKNIVLRRNENYWGPKTPMDALTVAIIQTDLAEQQQYRADEVDMIGPSAEVWSKHRNSEWLAEKGQSFMYYSPLGGYTYMGYNLRLPKFADKRVRQALTMLVDRQEIIDTLREGIGEVVTGPFFFQSDQYDPEIQPWPYDLEFAMEKLEEAGWADTNNDGVLDKDLDGDGVRDPFTINFLVPSGSAFGERLQRYVQSNFAEAGIAVNLETQEWAVFESRLTERDFEMVMLAWTSSAESDPYQIWHSSQAENRGSNYIGYKNLAVDELIEEARRTMDYDRRMEMWQEVHALINEDQPYTFLFNRPSLVFVDHEYKFPKHLQRLVYSEWWVSDVESP